MAREKPAVIVVTSLVARGGVGGRAAMFVLERLGFPVWFVPTVTLPWHPGHGKATRLVPDAVGFRNLVGDLAKSPKLAEVGAVFTGYVGDAAQVAPIAILVQAVMRANPRALYLCDPIIGDSDGLYQPQPIAQALRDRLLPLADIATPNRHELLWLANAGAMANDGIVAAARRLGPEEFVVTSAFAGAGEIGNLSVRPEGVHLAAHRMLAAAPHGTGDIFSALYLAARLDGESPADALKRASFGTFRMVELAAELKSDEMPLAAGQDALLATPTGVTVTRL